MVHICTASTLCARGADFIVRTNRRDIYACEPHLALGVEKALLETFGQDVTVRPTPEALPGFERGL